MKPRESHRGVSLVLRHSGLENVPHASRDSSVRDVSIGGKEELVNGPFHRLIEEKQLIGYKFDGFWASMDTFKDKQQLESLCTGGVAPLELWRTNDNTTAQCVAKA
jgi:NDP-sugar pyrophosphorylase family protein